MNDLRIVSWNAHSVYIPNGAEQLPDTLSQYKADHVLGVGALVRQKMKIVVIGFENISEWLCTLHLRGKFRNISLINVHAPTEETAESKKDNFYEAVERTLETYPKYDIKIILSDFNSEIAKEP